MLDHILRAFSTFKREHGVQANVLDINHTHYQCLTRQLPRVFGPQAEIELGFHVCLHPDHEQPHPTVRKMGAWYEANPGQRQRARELETLETMKAWQSLYKTHSGRG